MHVFYNFACILCLHTGNYEKARSIARKAEETSNLDTDEESSHRKRHAPLRFLSESDSDAGQLFMVISLLKVWGSTLKAQLAFNSVLISKSVF